MCETIEDTIMTAIGLDAKKAQLLSEIDSEELIDKMLIYLRSLKKKKQEPPCQYTLEELNARLDRAEEDVKNGRYTTHEEMKQKYLEWK